MQKRLSIKEVYDSLSEAPSQETIGKIQKAILGAGGQPYIVGGAVRDEMMPDTPPSKDIDFLITGMDLKKIAQVLSRLGKVSEVGQSFGVVKAVIDGEEFDFAIPRTAEKKTGTGHADFEVEVDPSAGPEDDLSRRDFTFNALAKGVDGRVIDLFGGQEDINRRLVRAVGDPKDRFSEDPLRMLRAIQFAVRFDFDIEKKTAEAIKTLRSKLLTVAPERVLEEFSKAWKKAKVPDSDQFAFLLDDLGVGETLFGRDFNPIDVDLSAGSDEDKIMKGFTAFFVRGGDTKRIRPTNEMLRHLKIARGSISDKQVWQFADESDRDKIPLVADVMDSYSVQIKRKLNKALKLPLSPKELAFSGQDFMAKGIHGRDIGEAQRQILAAIHAGKLKNDRDEIEQFIAPQKEEALSLIQVHEAVADEEYKIYCDMDGVLVNFQDGLVEFVNDFFDRIATNPEQFGPKTLKRTAKAFADLGGDLEKGKVPTMKFRHFEKAAGKKHLRNLSYSLVKTADVDFWLGLDWLPDGKQLWDYIKQYNPTILSSPIGEARGKIEWCKKNLGIPEDRIILSHQKYEYAEPDAILIDDMTKNTVPFDEAGGIIVLHKSAAKTIKELKKYGL
jgi:tRNA nucleotidyltransferase/poly(A) polymerase